MYDKVKIKRCEELLKSIPILNLVEEFNIDIDLKGKCSCLIHEETKPSMYIDIAKNKWFCFSCQHGGGTASLISDYYHLHYNATSYYDALSKYLANHKELISDLGFTDLIDRDYKPTTATLSDILITCDKLQSKEQAVKIPIKLKPVRTADISEILNYLITIQNKG